MIGVFQKLLHILALSPIHAEANFWKTPGIGGSNEWRINSEDESPNPLRSRRMARFAPNVDNFRIMNQPREEPNSDDTTTTLLPEVPTTTLAEETTTPSTEAPIPIITVLPETTPSIPTTTETTTPIPTPTPTPVQEFNLQPQRQPMPLQLYYDKTPSGMSPSGVDGPLSHSGFLRKMFPAMFILSAVSGFLCLYLKEVFHSNFKDADDANLFFARSGFLMWVSAWAFLSGQLFTTERDSYLIVAVSAIAFGSFFVATGYLLSAVVNIIFLIFTRNELGKQLDA